MVYNILDRDPKLAAIAHSDIDVVVHIFRIVQDLSYINWLCGCAFRKRLIYPPSGMMGYQLVIDKQNMISEYKYNWAVKLLNELQNQYVIRFGKQHKLSSMIRLLSIGPKRYKHVFSENFRILTPNKYLSTDPVLSYRAYYQETRPFSKWEKGVPAPTWWSENQMELLRQIRYKNTEEPLLKKGVL